MNLSWLKSIWFNDEVTHNWWKPPTFHWWIDPSGGEVSAPPKPWSLGDRLLESPIGAHSLGTLISFGVGMLVTGALWEAYAFSAVYAIVGQAQKADALFPLKGYNWRNIIWRLVIALVPLAIILILFG